MIDSRTRKGFTLIELLVVIAIIAVLAAILFPVFAAAREKARQATCASNLRQIWLGVAQYKNDYDNTMPMWEYAAPSMPASSICCVNNTGGEYTWIDGTLPYTKTLAVFTCPDFEGVNQKFVGNAAYPYAGNAISGWQTEYYSQAGHNDWDCTYLNGIPYASLVTTSEIIFCTLDATGQGASGCTWGNGMNVDERHQKHANYLFYDGHVKSLTISQTVQGCSSQGINECTAVPASPGFSYWIPH